MSLSCTNFKEKSKEISDENEEKILIKYISEIKNESSREKTLTDSFLYDYYLEKSKEKIGLYLWYSRGTVAVILQELIKLYSYLTITNTKKITSEISHKANNIFFLFQCIASNPVTKKELIESEILVYVLPFLSLTPNSKNTYIIKISTLCMLYTLSENCDIETFKFFEKYEIIPKLLKFVIHGKDKEKEFSFRIIQNLLNNLTVLEYICQVKERIEAISYAFNQILLSNCSKLKKNTIKILYFISIQNKEAKNVIKKKLYKIIKNLSFINFDSNTNNKLDLLIKILEEKNDINEIDNNPNSNSDSKIQKLKKDLYMNNNIKTGNNGTNNTQRQINNNNNEINNKLNLNMMYINNMNQFKINNNYMMPLNERDNYMINNNNIFNQNNGFGNMNLYGAFKNI